MTDFFVRRMDDNGIPDFIKTEVFVHEGRIVAVATGQGRNREQIELTEREAKAARALLIRSIKLTK
jgi:hypothetical protein